LGSIKDRSLFDGPSPAIEQRYSRRRETGFARFAAPVEGEGSSERVEAAHREAVPGFIRSLKVVRLSAKS
jgi:hypothetical protein